MGLSPCHALTVPLVLYLLLHCINAQFHCVFKDWFATANMNPDKVPDFNNNQWTYLFEDSHYQYPFDPDEGDIPRLVCTQPQLFLAPWWNLSSKI
jgi:hypothetical protein